MAPPNPSARPPLTDEEQRLLIDPVFLAEARRVSYAPDLVVRADGLSYGPGARFPTR